MNDPFFTVVVPTFNRAHYLKDVVPRLLEQSCADFELIVSDNASTDETQELVGQFKDPRVRYILRKENLGPVRNINACLEEAAGRYFVLHQDDDLVHNRFLERAREALENRPEIVFYAGVAWRAGERFANTSPLVIPPDNKDRFFMTEDRPIEIDSLTAAAKALLTLPFLFPAVAIRTNALREVGGFFEGSVYGTDVVTLIRLALLGKCIFDPRIAAYYRVHDDNISRTQPKTERLKAHRICRDEAVKILDDAGVDWQPAVTTELGTMAPDRLLHELKQLTESGAAPKLQHLVCQSLFDTWPRSRSRLFRKLISRVGPLNLLRYWINRP